MGRFARGFDRWMRSLVGDGASLPRLRLLYTLRCEGPQRMADLAEALEVTPRNVTALVDGLEHDGLVRREPHPTDRRATLIELQPAAHAIEEQYAEVGDRMKAAFETLTPSDRAELLRIMALIEERLRSLAPTKR